MNYNHLHTFVKGLRGDFVNNAESNEAFQTGVNGRLVSKNGKLSFSSIEGTKEVYSNPSIIKYLGFQSYIDELIIFVKHKCEGLTLPGIVENTLIEFTQNQEIVVDLVSGEFTFNTDLIDFTEEQIVFETLETSTIDSECVIEIVPFNPQTIYSLNYNVPNLSACSITNNSTPVNNLVYCDAIYSLTIDLNGNIVSKLIWAGHQNWDMDAKIVCVGIQETQNIKSIYYTDFLNVFRKVNIKKNTTITQSESDFAVFQNSPLLEPKFISYIDGGVLAGQTAFYLYRLISDNGQATEYSPLSKGIKIPKKYTADTFSGAEVNDLTQYGVKIKCEILNLENYSEIECIALEYEGRDIPTAIRNLGIKKINGIVEFSHYGNESEYSSNITITDLTQKKSTWQYCSSLAHNNNKLIAAGLRNNPIQNIENELKTFFRLKGYNKNGLSYNSCQYNPEPQNYNVIFPGYQEKLISLKELLFKSIKVYGNFIVELKNHSNNETISTSFVNSNNYNELLSEISSWLLEQYSLPTFQTDFPNLKISLNSSNELSFSRFDGLIQTDLTIFELSFDTLQVQIENDYDYDYNDINITGLNWVHGAISLGFNSGTGIRISYKKTSEKVLKKATSEYTGTGKILDVQTPLMDKGFFKGEIYRLFIQFKGNNQEFFAIPLGDVQVPKVNDYYTYIDDNGNPIQTFESIVNQYVNGDYLYSEKIKMKVEVRIGCKYKKQIDTYQLMYVERTEGNRTILCQGISAPLMRINPSDPLLTEWFMKDEDKILPDHWLLPYAGGPAFDKVGFENYDANGNDWEEALDVDGNNEEIAAKRVIYSRKMLYFDSPDIIYSGISDNLIESSKLDVIAATSPDHSDKVIATSSRIDPLYAETYPRFSRKIYNEQTKLEADDIDDYPKYNPAPDDSSRYDYFNNVSVFSKITYAPLLNSIFNIDKAIQLNPGTTASGSELGVSHNLSNNALYTPMNQSWFYGRAQRAMSRQGGECEHRYKFQVIPRSVKAKGKSTVFIKAESDVFTNTFLNNYINNQKVNPFIDQGFEDFFISSTHAIINIFRNNIDNVYGGRSDEDYSNNVVIPLGIVVPVNKTTNAAQVTIEDGDTYTTLFIRTKTGNSDSPYYEEKDDVYNGGTNCTNGHDNAIEDYRRVKGGWMYAVVLETMLEPKLSWDERVDLQSIVDLDIENGDNINSGYLQSNNLKVSIPKPYRFIDDPNMENIIAVSKTKLLGDFYDAWTEFLSNEFHELDKNVGPIHNLVVSGDKVYAIQTTKTAYIGFDERNFINTENGQIAVNSGSGTSISGHQYLSNFGTAIRRNVISNEFGITFFDENKREFVKDFKPLFIENDLDLKISEMFENDPIVNVEMYLDPLYKETNARLVTKSGIVFFISYNELLKVFNGNYEYDHDVYMEFNNKVFAPKKELVDGELTNKSLRQLNVGNYLNIDDSLKTMTIGLIVSNNPVAIDIFKTMELITNIDYKINYAKIRTNLNAERTISGDHFWYLIKEGKHRIPFKNPMVQFDIDEYKDMRGYWAYVELNISSRGNKKIDIFAVDIQLRKSFG